MPFTGNPGDGSESNPFQVTTKAQYDAMSSASGVYYILMADIDYEGGTLLRRTGWSSNIDFNGYKVFNYNGLDANLIFRDISGVIKDPWYDGTLSNNAGGGVFLFDIAGGSVTGIRVDGTIQNTGGSAGVIKFLGTGSTVNNVNIDADIIASSGEACIIESSQIITVDKILFTGAMSTTGTASLQFFGAVYNGSATNCFYVQDGTTNVGMVQGGATATAKTPTELQTLATYTDTATVGLSTAYDMVRISSFTGSQTWTIADTDGVEYPKLGYQIEPAQIPSVTFKDETGTAISGALVRFFTVDAFDSKSPAFTNFTLVGSAYTTDANGVATYDPNTDPAVDGTKVYGAIAFDAEAGSTEMEVSTGISFGRQNVDVTLP